MPTATEHDIAWRVVDEMIDQGRGAAEAGVRRAHGRNGRLSVQTDPRFYRDTDAIVRQAEHFAALAPNIIVKIPVTAAGIPAIEEATYRGISINATVCFSLPQCVAVAEAVERGLRRREQEGKDIATMGPVCTIMVGPARRLAEGRRRQAGHQRRPRRARVGGRRGVQEDLPPVPGARLPHPAAVGRVPQPHALERADRRRRGDLAAARLAEALQQIRHQRRVAHRHAGRARRPDGARDVRRLPPRLDRAWPVAARSSTPFRRPAARCGSSSPRATISTGGPRRHAAESGSSDGCRLTEPRSNRRSRRPLSRADPLSAQLSAGRSSGAGSRRSAGRPP